MGKLESFHDLRVYQLAYTLALEIHRVTRKFPRYEEVELGRQLRRAATSIPANIAEGFGRRSSTDDFKRFLRMALGSCDEVRVWLNMVKDLHYVSESKYTEWIDRYDQVGRMLTKMIQNWS